jgi:exopolyphosphatase / guanosine-5'-triphosphate,3'-diphosphate pyrophosphatase
MMNSEYKLAAAIDVGSNYIRMCIAQVFEAGHLTIIEDLSKPTNIGRDTFSKGRISIETINEACDSLKSFVQVMKEYKIRHYIAVATTGIREAENQEYVIEQIKIKAGLELEVINNVQERFYIIKALRAQARDSGLGSTKSTLIVNITAGGVDTSVYDKEGLKFIEHVNIGSLRLREQLVNLERTTFNFSEIIKEFIESKIHFIKSIIMDMDIKILIGLGGELGTIYSLCYGKENTSEESVFIEKDKLEFLYRKLIEMSSNQIIEVFQLPKRKEEILLPSVIFFMLFLDYTKTDGIDCPKISLKHGLLYYLGEKIFNEKHREEGAKDIVDCVFYIASKYNIDIDHASYVRKLALSIFDQTIKIHNMGSRERLYLEVCSVLHDVGKYISYSEHDLHSYNIIRSQNILGFSDRELELIANTARYHEGSRPNRSHINYGSLSPEDRMRVSKLTAILQIAESLDVSRKQKIRNIHLSISGNKISFSIDARDNILLEEWSFNNNSSFFEEVIGIKPIIRM